MQEFLIEQDTMQSACKRLANKWQAGQQKNDFILRLIRQRLLEAVNDLNISPATICELGCGAGDFLQKLQQLYPQAKCVGVDLLPEMLQLCSPGFELHNADAENLHFLPEDNFDLVVSNCLLPMLSDPFKVAVEWLRVMQPGGTVCFTTLGPDSFKEIKQAFFAAGDAAPHVHAFYDMHDVGDAWRAAGGKDVVLHCEKQVIAYNSPQDVFQDLKLSGFINASASRRRGLTGKSLWQKALQMYPCDTTAKFPLTLEVITAVIKTKLSV